MFRSILSLLILVIAFTPIKSEAKEISTDSKITKATVYTNRADVTRIANITVPKGSHKIIFTNLPTSMMTDSIRIKGEALSNADVIFGSVSSKMVMSSELTGEKEKALNDKLQEIEDKIKATSAVQAALTSKKDFIKNISKQANLRSDEAIAELKLNSGEWTEAADVIFKNISDIGKADLELQIKRRELNKEANKIRRELSQLRRGSKSTYTVTIPVEASQDTKMQVALSYQVTGANWRPIYDARLSTSGKQKLEIIQYGSVSQRTGEDWKDIELTLSTAQPQRGTSLPPLYPMWVDIWKNDSKNKSFGISTMAMQAAPMMEEEKAMDVITNVGSMRYGAAPTKARKKAKVRQAKINTGGFVSEYKIVGKSDILSDGTEAKLLIGSFKTENSIEVHVKPQVSTNAFLVASAKLKGDAPILPGKVSLFRDGSYIGKSNFPLLRPDEKHDLYFGIDDQISVKRKILKDESKEAGLISKDKIQEKHFVTEIRNLHKNTIKMVVQETTPVGKNERIQVEILKDYTTAGYKEDSDNIKGMLTWHFDMPAKSKKELKLGWHVTWPKDFNIRGL